MFNGLGTHLGNLFLASNAISRSISPENFTGEKGGGARCELENGVARHAARELGKGWKVNPYIKIEPRKTFTLAEIKGPGCLCKPR